MWCFTWRESDNDWVKVTEQISKLNNTSLGQQNSQNQMEKETVTSNIIWHIYFKLPQCHFFIIIARYSQYVFAGRTDKNQHLEYLNL